MSRFDIVLYGASGFTGQYVIEFLHKAAVEHNLSWAVAGRDEGRLKAALARAGAIVEADLSRVQTIICDSSDTSSLLAMASQAKLVLNCVGPYRFFGEPVVEACVEAGSHHVDISGEPQYLEKMQLKYHQKAVENGVYVIGACGFDSIPADMGQICVREAMEGDVNSVESYLRVIVPDLPGATINFGTWQSAIHGFAHAKELGSLRKQIYPERMPASKPKLMPRGSLHYSNIVNTWCMPFMGSDKSVMTRTQRGFFHDKEQRPTNLACYAQFQSLWSCFMLMIVGLVFGILANYTWGRTLLETFPGVFSFGAVSKSGVPKKKADNTNFEMTLVGEGWKTRVDQEKASPPNRRVTTVVKGKNMGYGATCECMVQSGMVILQELSKLPNAGGVYSPGYAFADTTLVQRLTERDVTFSTVVQDI
eukprot:GFUD01020350.1.p1 GENE.GFUD01020350.1~~GFUD01020350.1.p1  ORF type:complete len:421 (-),score=109.24 GFUD01020350.1:86-1348(-)